MKKVIQTAYGKLHYLMNIRQAKNGELEKAILDILLGVCRTLGDSTA